MDYVKYSIVIPAYNEQENIPELLRRAHGALRNGRRGPVVLEVPGDVGRAPRPAAAVAGYGSITVPAAYDAGLPIGISFIGGRWSEPELIADAFAFEAATNVRVKPTYIPTIGDALFPGVPNPASTLRPERAQAAHPQGRDLVVRLR